MAPPIGKPGFFAPKGEKRLYKAINTRDPHVIRQVGLDHPSVHLDS